MLTEGAVAGLYSVKAENEDGGSRITLKSCNAASTAAELENLLAKAAANGDIEVPDSIGTSDGTVDSQTLLFDLLQRSLQGGTAKEVAAAQEIRSRAFAASAAKTDVAEGKRYYTVQSGDSLVYISLQFHGSTNACETIFEANRAKVASLTRFESVNAFSFPKLKVATLAIAGLAEPGKPPRSTWWRRLYHDGAHVPTRRRHVSGHYRRRRRDCI